jgi:hypothetical protein
MLKVWLLAVAVGVAVPSVAFACMNGVEHKVNYNVIYMTQAEKYMESAQWTRAQKKLAKIRTTDTRLRARADDMLALIRVRLGTEVQPAIEHFKGRSEAQAKNVRYRAWLAEAYVAAGEVAAGREILLDLTGRDLMPDAYAYLALAKASRGAERLAAWKTCRTKARDKDICELPMEVVNAKVSARS